MRRAMRGTAHDALDVHFIRSVSDARPVDHAGRSAGLVVMRRRTELIIFIRPQIIRDGIDAHYVAEELRAKLRGQLGASVVNEVRVPVAR